MPTKQELDAINHLRLPQTATKTEINRAFRKAMFKCHPDKQVGKTAQEKEAAAREFDTLQKLQDAIKTQNDRQQANAQSAEGAVRDSQMHEAHKQFSLDSLTATLEKKSGGKGKLEVLDETQTKQLQQDVKNPESAIVSVGGCEQLANLAGKYKYTRSFEDRPPVSVNLDLTEEQARVFVDPNNEDSVRAAAELIKGMGAMGMMVPDTLTKEQHETFQRVCKEEGLECRTYSTSPKPEPSKPAAIEDAPSATASDRQPPAITDRVNNLALQRAESATSSPPQQESPRSSASV